MEAKAAELHAALPVQGCADSEVCAAVSSAVIQAAELPVALKPGDVGICVEPPAGGLQLPKYAVVPPPRYLNLQ